MAKMFVEFFREKELMPKDEDGTKDISEAMVWEGGGLAEVLVRSVDGGRRGFGCEVAGVDDVAAADLKPGRFRAHFLWAMVQYSQVCKYLRVWVSHSIFFRHTKSVFFTLVI